MKFKIKNKSGLSLNSLMRRIGYHFNGVDKRSEEKNFIKSLQGGRFPRFHLYIEKHEDGYLFKLHIDQKAPSYGKHTAHSGEYEGKVIEKEVERIKKQI